jgi:hypothetical protein
VLLHQHDPHLAMAATHALFRGAAKLLAPQGKLVLYGPYLENGKAVRPNLEFDASLKRRNAEWGLRAARGGDRRGGPVTACSACRSCACRPNNLTVVFGRSL